MRHALMTCENHPTLRWSCKEIAVSGDRYNGCRNIFFLGAFLDGKLTMGLECDCPASKLILAAEDATYDREA
jgi:hypothetical protein